MDKKPDSLAATMRNISNIRIGYQGDVGSNAEAAARHMAKSCAAVADSLSPIENASLELVPLISSAEVVKALDEGCVQFGVMAVRNSIGGEVAETSEALREADLNVVHSCVLEIHHCLFKLPGTAVESLTAIASHPQALKQTERNRKRLYSNLKAIEIEDTASGARKLAAGELEQTYAVLCKETAGEANGLELVARNLEDEQPNLTRFLMFEA